MRRLVLGAVLLILACEGAATLPAPSQPTAARISTPIPEIDVYDMMGTFPPTTFFVVTPTSVKAVALLNHTTKYTIPVEGDAQVAVGPAARRLYVMDRRSGGVLIRSFDVSTGAPRSSAVMRDATLLPSDSAHATLAVDASTGEVFALVGRGALRAIQRFDGDNLEPGGSVLGDLVCGDRILAAAGRLVMACMEEGMLVTSEPGGGGKFRADGSIVAMAMLSDGTLMSGSADARMWRLARGTTQLERLDTLKERGTVLLRDGIAAQGDCCFVFGVVEGVSIPQVRVLVGGNTLLLFPDAQRPQGGILLEPPFAYYTTGSQARHIDIQQGFSEVMVDVGERALPGAVADR